MNLFSKIARRFSPAMAMVRRGNALANEGEYEAAITEFDEAIARDPDFELAYYCRGAAYAQMGKFSAALADYDDAIRLKPDFAQAYYNRGLARAFTGDYDGTIEDMTHAIDKRLSEKYLAFGTRGSAYFARGDIDAAHADYLRAETILVGWVYARAGLAICHHALGEAQAARELWSGLIAKDARYRDLDWVAGQFSWAEPLLAQAEAIIHTLD
jgi:tetratricopeptide (TPR) repeat protein